MGNQTWDREAAALAKREQGTPRKKKYTVLLAYDDGESHNDQTFQVWVKALNPQDAAKMAEAVFRISFPDMEEDEQPWPLCIYRGHLNDEYGGE